MALMPEPDITASASVASGRRLRSHEAAFREQVIPQMLVCGKIYEICISMHNIGTTTWSSEDRIRLAIWENAVSTAGQEYLPDLPLEPLPLPSESSIQPGDTVTFSATFFAPSTPGRYRVCLRLRDGSEEEFGDATTEVIVEVGLNDAAFMSQLVPTEMTAGIRYTIVVCFRNTGTSAWGDEKFHRLGHCGTTSGLSNDMSWSCPRAFIPPNTLVRPGEVIIFRFDVVAPELGGNYTMSWRMLKEGLEWFGEATPPVVVKCIPPVQWPGRIDSILSKVEELLESKIDRILGDRLGTDHSRIPPIDTTQKSSAIAQGHNVSELATRIDRLFLEWDRPDSPGFVVACIENGEILYQRGYGMSSLENDIPLIPGSVFAAGSLAKQFIGFALLLLCEQRKLRFDDPLRLYVPEFPLWGSAITIRHLLHHTSGIEDGWELLSRPAWREDKDVFNESIVEPVIRQEMQKVIPGERFLYSQTGYTLLEMIMQRVTNGPIASYLQGQVFGPLKMMNSSLHHSPVAVVKGRVSVYERGDAPTFRVRVPDFATMVPSSLFTTAEDLARWDRNYLTGDVGAGILELMQERGTLNDGYKIGYACGLMTGHKGVKTFEHSGTDYGCRSHYVRFVKSRCSIVVLTNLAEINPVPLAHTVAQVVHRWRDKTTRSAS